MSPRKMLMLAAKVARLKNDGRNFCLGAAAIRGDGVIVYACNGAPERPNLFHHAETRLIRRLDRGATVFLARTLADNTWALSKPCFLCEKALQRAYVKRVYYTIAPNEWGCLEL